DAAEVGSCSRHKAPPGLLTGAALDERLAKIADDAHRDEEDDDENDADVAEAIGEDRVEALLAEVAGGVDREPRGGDDERADHPAPDALPALAGADRGSE